MSCWVTLILYVSVIFQDFQGLNKESDRTKKSSALLILMVVYRNKIPLAG